MMVETIFNYKHKAAQLLKVDENDIDQIQFVDNEQQMIVTLKDGREWRLVRVWKSSKTQS